MLMKKWWVGLFKSVGTGECGHTKVGVWLLKSGCPVEVKCCRVYLNRGIGFKIKPAFTYTPFNFP